MRKFKRLALVLIMSVLACACMFGATACDNILSRGDREKNSSESSSVCTHNWAETVTQATCTSTGKVEMECKSCGYKETKTISKLSHSYDIEKSKTPATCLEKGSVTLQCKTCTSTKTVEIEALGHDYVTVPAKAATCTEDGYYEYKKCGRCDAVEYTKPGVTTAAKNKIAKLGHKRPMVWDGIEYVAKVATCQNDVKCERCEYVYEEKLDHTTELGMVAAKEPTCLSEGWDKYTYCKVCTYTTKLRKAALGHDGERAENVDDILIHPDSRAQTCTDLAYCGFCSMNFEFGGKKPSHDTECKVEGSMKADCVTAAYCGKCENYFGFPLGHIINTYKAQDPTCEDIGWEAYEECLRAGCDYTTRVELEALGHLERTIFAVEVTCTEAGWTEGSQCVRCLHVFVEPELIPALGHDGQRDGQSGTEFDYISSETRPADCSTKAYCGICDRYYGDVAPVGYHNLETVAAKTPTCMESGWNTYEICLDCTYSTYEENYLPKVPCSYRTAMAKAPTCLEEGNETVTYCVFCEKDLYEAAIIPALGHDEDCTRNADSKPKTCTEKAYCGDCGEYYGNAPAGHYLESDLDSCTDSSVCLICGEEVHGGHLVRPDGSCYHCGEYVKKKED